MGILKSKKFLTMLTAVIGLIIAGLSGAQPWGTIIVEIVAAVVAYITAQGIADAGKEAAKIRNGR